MAARLPSQALHVTSEQPEGPPAEGILECAQRIQADVLTLTTHGRGGLGCPIFRSVADEVLRKAACPVVLVRSS